MSKNKSTFTFIAMVCVAGCNTQQGEGPTTPAANPVANSQGSQTRNDGGGATVGNVQRGEADRQQGDITQIALDPDEFTELFGDTVSMTNPSPADMGKLEEATYGKFGDDREDLEDKIEQCKAAPARCEIIREL